MGALDHRGPVVAVAPGPPEVVEPGARRSFHDHGRVGRTGGDPRVEVDVPGARRDHEGGLVVAGEGAGEGGGPARAAAGRGIAVDRVHHESGGAGHGPQLST